MTKSSKHPGQHPRVPEPPVTQNVAFTLPASHPDKGVPRPTAEGDDGHTGHCPGSRVCPASATCPCCSCGARSVPSACVLSVCVKLQDLSRVPGKVGHSRAVSPSEAPPEKGPFRGSLRAIRAARTLSPRACPTGGVHRDEGPWSPLHLCPGLLVRCNPQVPPTRKGRGTDYARV